MFDFDVVVIGGGPAGSAAAIKCAQSNLRVAIVEAEEFPRDRPGETLHPGIEPLLAQLGVAERVLGAGFLRHEGNWVEWNGDRHFVPFGGDESGAWLGFQAWRADFDAILLDRARNLGVEVLQPCRALQPILAGGKVAGVTTSQGALRANFTIDAAGNRQWLARQLGLTIKPYSPRLIARYGYVAGECCLEDLPILIGGERKWKWLAKVRPQLYQWTQLNLGQEIGNMADIPPEFATLQPKGKTQVADVTWRICDRPAGLGYFLVGDAATVLDPASSHGVLKAIMSGIMAAHLIKQTATQNSVPAARAYSDWVYKWFEHDVAKLKEFYKLL